MARPTDGQAWPRNTPGADGTGVPVGGTTGQVLAKASNADGDTEWADPSGGGGGAEFPFSAPGSPSAYDDEFTSASLGVQWTVVTAPDGTFTVDPDFQGSFYSMKSLGHATLSLNLIREAIGAEGDAGTAFTLTARLLLTSYAGTEFMDLTIGDNSTFLGGNFLILGLLESSSAFKAQAYDGSLIVDEALGKFQGELWVHYQRSTGNVCKLYVSHNGIQWRRVNSATRTWDINFLFIRQLGSTTAGEASEHLIDFVRVNDARFFQQV